MTRKELEQEMSRQNASRTQYRLRWVHGKGYAYTDLSDISGSPVTTIRNLILGRTNRTRDKDLIEWTDILFDGIKDGSIPSKTIQGVENRRPCNGSHKKRRKKLHRYKYTFAKGLLSKKRAAEYSIMIERLLLYGTSYKWIAKQIGSDNAVILRLHRQIYFDPPDKGLSSLPKLLYKVENEELIPPVSKRRPRLDPRIYAKCHKQLLQLLSHFSKADLLNKLGVEYNVLQNFLIGNNERFPYPARVEKLLHSLTTNSIQSSDKGNKTNIYNISA